MAELQSIITCPECGHSTMEAMPTDACVFVYECARCGGRLEPRKDDYCVFCSYGSVPYPPVQAERMGRDLKG
jgi:DNA-directed RNA polymerase subunit RPC12/RpoP